jgi:hypothetical protein
MKFISRPLIFPPIAVAKCQDRMQEGSGFIWPGSVAYVAVLNPAYCDFECIKRRVSDRPGSFVKQHLLSSFRFIYIIYRLSLVGLSPEVGGK